MSTWRSELREPQMRIAITGHTNLTDATIRMVASAVTDYLQKFAPTELIGISCLASGADALFARVVLDLGGLLEVVLPSAAYRQTVVHPEFAAEFDDLLASAANVRVVPLPVADREAFEAANNELIDTCDQLIAVWDGMPSQNRGCTATVVAGARARGLGVTVIWPPGAVRCS